MRIAGRDIGPNQPPYVIAELGVNHDGSPDRLARLVHAAADAGASAVKLQLFAADDLLARQAPLAAYQRAAGEQDAHAMLARLQLPLREAARAVELAHDLGLHAIATVFDLPLLAPACTIGLDALKTASPDLVHKPLLEAIMATGLPMIVSTGAATAQEVARTIGWLAPAADRLAVLQCVSCYPTAPTDAAVGAIAHLAQLAPGPVGYSDHTTDEDTGALAVSLGACVLEKHLTLDRSAPGPDHAASLEPGPFARYVALCRQTHRRQWRPAPDDPRTGQGLKALLPVEAEVRRLARRSIVAATDLPAGHTLGPDDLAYKRPAGGLEPWQDADLLGRTLARPIAADEPILFEHLAPAARARPHAP